MHLVRTTWIPALLTLAACSNSPRTLEEIGVSVRVPTPLCCTVGTAGVAGTIELTNESQSDDVSLSVSAPAGVSINSPAFTPTDPRRGSVVVPAGSTVSLEVFVATCPDPDFASVSIFGINEAVEHIDMLVKDPPPDDTLPDLLVPVNVTALESIRNVFDLGFATGPSAWVAGSDGFTQVDLTTGSIVTQTGADSVQFDKFNDPSGIFGVAPLRYESGGTTEEGIFTYGSSSGTFQPLLAAGWANFVQLAFQQGVSDASYLIGKSGGHQIIVSHGGVSSFHYDEVAGSWTRTILANSVAGGALSTVARERADERLAVTDGMPGALYLLTGDDPAVTPTKIADLENGPRLIRAAGRLAVVSNHDSDSLTLIRWELDGTVEVLGSCAVGDGPLGIDVRLVPQGIAIVSTGQNDNTYTITVVDPTTLVVVSKITKPVPTGLTGPAYASWFNDTQIMIAGNTSNNVALVNVSTELDGDA